MVEAMSNRLPENATEIIDRSKPVTITYRQKAIQAFEGDTVASALHAAGIKVMARSFKYHRPRGIMDLGAHATEPTMEVDGRPNTRIARSVVRNGMHVEPEGRLENDIFSLADSFSWAMPPGFYYKSFYKSEWVWKKVMKVIRKAPGILGEVKPLKNKPLFDEVNLTPELLVIGAGLAGMEAALMAAKTGVRIVLVEAEPWLGGFEAFQGEESLSSIQEFKDRLKEMENLMILTSTTAASAYPDGLVACIQSCRSDEPFVERSYLIRPRAVVVATGAMDRPLLFNHNDRPGVMLPQTAQRLIHLYRLKPGKRALVAGGDDHTCQVALDLARNGVEVVGVADSRQEGFPEKLEVKLAEAGVPFLPGYTVMEARGKQFVGGADLVKISDLGKKTLNTEAIIASCGRTPLFKILAQAGAKMEFHQDLGIHMPTELPPGYQAAGRVMGLEDRTAIRAQGRLAAATGLARLGLDTSAEVKEAKEILAGAPTIGSVPRQFLAAGSKERRFVCFANDVTEEDIDFAMAEGFGDTEMLKRYTTATMGPEQGALSLANFLEYLAQKQPGQLGQQTITTARAPLVGVSMGVLAAGHHDQPRITPLHHVQMEQGGKPMRSGPWIRMRHFGNPEEENLAVRNAAGICDVSTLGKFRIFGPDAEKLLNRVNLRGVDGLRNEKILYTAACNEEGVVIDDGVVIRLEELDYYFTTSTARGPVTKEWYTRWCREEDWQVWLVPLTDAMAGMNLAGPKSREILSQVIEGDISDQTLPFMHWVKTKIAGIEALVFRMGFLGELSYEIHCPASQGGYLWNKLLESGSSWGLNTIGLETQLICRLEKGHVLPGLDTDGNTTLFESHLDWLWDRSKEDTVGGPMLKLLEGQKFQQQVIGFSLDGRVGLVEGHMVVYGMERLGYITSVSYSPTLNQTVGLALVKPHESFKEGGEVTLFLEGKDLKGRYVKPPFYDPKGERMRI